jgi:hypothetical protein
MSHQRLGIRSGDYGNRLGMKPKRQRGDHITNTTMLAMHGPKETWQPWLPENIQKGDPSHRLMIQ